MANPGQRGSNSGQLRFERTSNTVILWRTSQKLCPMTSTTQHGCARPRRTSVSTLVRDYLIRVAAQGSTYERLLDEQEALLTQIHERAAGYDAAQRLRRADVHDRDALR